MREAFEIVRGAVSAKDLVPVLTHFAFDHGVVYGANGRVELCAPVPELAHLACTVPAAAFIAAMDGCEEEEPKIELISGDNDTRHLVVRSKRFRATIPAGDAAAFPHIELEGEGQAKASLLDNHLLPVLSSLRPLVGEDASRAWCATVQVKGGIVTATNNVVLASITMSPAPKLPEFALPVFAIDELLRLQREPRSALLTPRAISFDLAHGVRLTSLLLNGSWPDTHTVLDAVHKGAVFTRIDAGAMRDAINAVRPFCGDQKLPRVNLKNTEISAVGNEMSGRIRGFKGLGRGDMTFYCEPLLQALSLAHAMGWAGFPRVPFTGPALRGVVLGLPRT